MSYEIDNTKWVSPNHSPRTKPISMIVVHSTASDTLKSAADWLCLESSEVSTHYIIDELGNIFQLVNDDRVAWHAGNSAWNGLETIYKKVYKTGDRSVNDVSLGIELVNSNNGKDPYEAAQVAALTWLVEFKGHQYGIELDNIVRHLDIATFYPSGKVGRKTDPAGFSWATWKKGLTIGSDEGVWALWGSMYPLYPDARHFGIPQAWFKKAALLGEARSNAVYADDLVIQVFQRGVVLYRNGQSKVVLDTDINVS